MLFYSDNLVELHQGDCREIMRELPDGCVDLVLTDPPYGCGKAEWDDHFPQEWYPIAKRLDAPICIITGSSGLRDSIRLVGDDFVDVIAARNLNSRTRSPIGFSNWLATVVACGKLKQGPNFFEFAVRGKMPEHPSPKPLEFMKKIVERASKSGDLILDPFMGSGTTGVACVQTGRKFIGIEIDKNYCEIAKQRIIEAQQQLRLSLDGAA